jgi:hypothetical protein
MSGPMPRPSSASIAAALCVLSVSWASHAQPEDDEKQRGMATDLFDKGVKIMVAHKCDEATPIPAADRAPCAEALDLFVKATKIYPRALGAHRNAGLVARGLGRVALAARSFREVARKAPLEASESRRRWAAPAAKEADLLEPRVPHLVVKLSPDPTPDGLVVRLDGEPIGDALLKTQISLDPGEHDVTAEAPGYKGASQHIKLAEKELVDVALTLVALPKPAEAVVAGTSGPSGESPPPPAKMPIAPIVVTATGGVLLGVGLVFGAMAKATKDGCSGGLCASQSDIDKAKSQATLSTVLTAVGVAAAAGGATWWVLSSSKSGESTALSPLIVPGGGGLVATRVIQ